LLQNLALIEKGDDSKQSLEGNLSERCEEDNEDGCIMWRFFVIRVIYSSNS
jgi:hypothetical protein